VGSLIDGTRGIPVDIGIHQKSVAMPSSMDVCISSISATVLTNKQNNKRQLPDDDDCSSSGLEAPKLPANLNGSFYRKWQIAYVDSDANDTNA